MDFAADLTIISAIWMAGLVLLVPLIGLTLRFGLVPLLRITTEGREGAVGGLRERMLAMEERLAEVESTLAVEPSRRDIDARRV